MTPAKSYIKMPSAHNHAVVAELADALGSGPSGVRPLQVQVLSTAEVTYNPNHEPVVKLIGEGFGFFCQKFLKLSIIA